MKFEWDDAKRKSNLEKHGLDFADAWMVFQSERKITFEDVKHSQQERRQITLGYVDDIICLVVVHTDRSGITRIISFRMANKKERRLL